jgi:hypothetical protein
LDPVPETPLGENDLENGESMERETPPVEVVLEDEERRKPAHRPVSQRWHYEPVSPVSTTMPSELSRSKRRSKPPQRLTSSRLGHVSSTASIHPGVLGLLANGKSSSCISTVSDEDEAELSASTNDGKSPSLFLGLLANEKSSSCVSKGSDEAELSASTNGESPSSFLGTFFPFSSLLEVLALDADKIGSMERGCGSTSEMTDGVMSLQESSEETGPPLSAVPVMMLANPRERFSVGDGSRTGRFTIRLTFPGHELPDQTMVVTTCMTVPTLRRRLADLMGQRHGVSIFVAPSWDLLDHGGFITELYLPGTDTPCPALAPGSLVRVHPWEPFHDDPNQGSSSVGDVSLMRGPKRSRESNYDSGSGSDSSSPPPERLFPLAPVEVSDEEGASSAEESKNPPTVTRRVLRHERAILMKAFKREQRFARRTHRKELRANFDEGTQVEQDRKNADFYPYVTEVEEEALRITSLML